MINILGTWAAIFVCVYMLLDINFDRDSTDSEDKRSGMSLHTDNATGCQYLSAAWGGLTPRLTPDGQHMGCR